MNENNTPNKEQHSHSIYMYTALIFIVAILMIVLAFFGQSNLNKNQIAEPTGNSISEKSAALSEENLVLRERNATLQDKLEKTAEELIIQTELKETREIIISAVISAKNGDYIKASQILDTINKDLLGSEDLEIYNAIKEKAREYEAPLETDGQKQAKPQK